MRECTYDEFQKALAKNGWPKATYEFGKRYSVVRYSANFFNAEKHDYLKRGKTVSTTYMVDDRTADMPKG